VNSTWTAAFRSLETDTGSRSGYSYESFDCLLDDFHVATDNPRYQLVEQGKKLCRLQSAMFSSRMIGSVRRISLEYMLWLRKQPKMVEKVSWEAFERIVAEVFAAKGFAVDITRRVRNDTCDVFAVRADEFGTEARYLIECKRYQDSRRVGLSIVKMLRREGGRNESGSEAWERRAGRMFRAARQRREV